MTSFDDDKPDTRPPSDPRRQQTVRRISGDPQSVQQRPMPVPVSQRRVYRAGDEAPPVRRTGRGAGYRQAARTADEPATSAAARRSPRRSPLLAIVVLVAIIVVFAIVAAVAHGGGLTDSQNSGTFKLLPLTTTTTT
jgi:hypothetical protein